MNNIILIKRFFENQNLPKDWIEIKNKYKLFHSQYKKLSIISTYKYDFDKEFSIFSESKLIFYSKKEKKFIKMKELNLIYKKTKYFNDDVINGDLFSITDSCFCTYESKGDNLYLFSSCCGSGTIYFSKLHNEYFFATHTNFLKNIRKYNISKLGLSEIIRFGANYSHNTILKELKKIPFASVLSMESEKLNLINSYYSKIKYLVSENYQFNSLFKDVINSYKLDKTSILFSTGIDSTVIAESTDSIKDVKLLYMRNKKDDFQDEKYLDYMETKGNKIKKIVHNRNFNKLIKTISSYSLPTIDFSILPTKQLLDESYIYSGNIIEGTGGDAWFGFSEIKNQKFWRILSPLNHLSIISSAILMRLFVRGINIKFINYILYILSRLSFSKRPEISQLASNPYSFCQIKTTKKEWEMIEKKISNQIDSFTENKCTLFDKFRLTDACLVAISQFAAKTGQSSLRFNTQVFYPYFHPLIVSFAMKLKKDQIFQKDLGFKVILKKFLTERKFANFYIYRKKIGFQPPLKDIFLDVDNVEFIHKLINKKNPKLDIFFNKIFLNSIKEKKMLKNCNSIKELYMIWSYLSIKVWLEKFNLE